MRVTVETIGDRGAPLTGYLLNTSDEMATTAVRPAVLVLPGGGYFFTSDREAEPVALAYLAEGFHAFVLRYSTGSDAPYEASLADGRAALRWLREHADELGVDPTRIAVVGFSAGGHLAASLGVSPEKPDALVLGYPVTLAEFGELMEKDVPDIGPLVSAETPPTFLFSTSCDELVPIRNSLALLDALARHGVPFESHVYLRGPHGISLAKALTANGRAAMADEVAARWLPDSITFLHRVLGDFPTDDEATAPDAGQPAG